MAKPVDLVIFGASGELPRRKGLPRAGHLVGGGSQNVRVIGAGRSPKSTDEFRAFVKDASGNDRLAGTAEWIHLDYADPATFAPLKQIVEGPPTTIFYLATPAETFSEILAGLTASGLADRADVTPRIVVEQPLGHNLASPRQLNAQLAAPFQEEQIFRLDHYMTKHTRQNVMDLPCSHSI